MHHNSHAVLGATVAEVVTALPKGAPTAPPHLLPVLPVSIAQRVEHAVYLLRVSWWWRKGLGGNTVRPLFLPPDFKLIVVVCLLFFFFLFSLPDTLGCSDDRNERERTRKIIEQDLEEASDQLDEMVEGASQSRVQEPVLTT